MRQDSCEALLFLVEKDKCKFTVTLNLRCVLPEKTERIRKGCCDARFCLEQYAAPVAVGRVTFKFTVTLNARRILPEKTSGFWGGWYGAIFFLKHKEFGSGRPRVI